MHNAGNTGCVVGSIGLKLSAAKCLLKCILLVKSLVDRIRLVAVCYDRLVAIYANRRVDDQAGIFHLGRVKSLCADTFSVLYEDAVSAVDASSHDKVSGHCLGSVSASADHDAAAGVTGLSQNFLKICHYVSSSPWLIQGRSAGSAPIKRLTAASF